MTFAEIEYAARQLIAEPEQGFLKSAEFMTWLNDVQIDLALRLPTRALRKIQSFTDWAINTTTLTVTLPSDLLKLVQWRIHDDRDIGSFFPDSYEEMGEILRGMKIEYYYTGEQWGDTITFSNLPINSTLRLYYIKRPTIIVRTGDIPEFPEDIQRLLMPTYLAKMASIKLDDVNKYNLHTLEYEKRLNMVQNRYKGREFDQIGMDDRGKDWD
jgi:hypothetical protein